MRISIIGAGAIGCALGALLARNGQEIILIGRPTQVTAIGRDGLRVDGRLGEFAVHVAAAEALNLRPDLAFLTVKTQDVVIAVRDNMAYLNDVTLVTFQNGVRSDELVATILPQRHILSAVVLMGALYLTPGKVTIVQKGSIVIGRPLHRRDAEVTEVARILERVIPTHISDNIEGAHWLKLIINLNNALPALTNYTISQVSADPYLSRLAVGLLREAIPVIDRAGIELESLPSVPVGMLRLASRLPIGLVARFLHASPFGKEASWPRLGSTLQSIRRGRPTEIDYLNGEIVQLGKRVGMATPLNAKIVELAHSVEQTGQFFSAGAIRQSIGEV